jgi:hypothetical protein
VAPADRVEAGHILLRAGRVTPAARWAAEEGAGRVAPTDRVEASCCRGCRRQKQEEEQEDSDAEGA